MSRSPFPFEYDDELEPERPGDRLSGVEVVTLAGACILGGVALSTSLFVAGVEWLERRIGRRT